MKGNRQHIPYSIIFHNIPWHSENLLDVAAFLPQHLVNAQAAISVGGC